MLQRNWGLQGTIGGWALKAEQRITAAQLYAEFTTPAGSVFSVLVIMAPEDNIIVSNLTWAPAGQDPARLAVNVSQWVLDVGAPSSAGAPSAREAQICSKRGAPRANAGETRWGGPRRPGGSTGVPH